MLMLCAVSAFATEINWDDLKDQAAETIAKGDFVEFDEIAIKMWMPTVLAATELTDDDRDQGYIGYFMSEDESCAISVMYGRHGAGGVQGAAGRSWCHRY
jgi:hypothetical protein